MRSLYSSSKIAIELTEGIVYAMLLTSPTVSINKINGFPFPFRKRRTRSKVYNYYLS